MVPSDGTFTYSFAMHFPVNSGFGDPRIANGSLVVNDGQLTFFGSSSPFSIAQTLEIDIERTGTLLTGNIGGAYSCLVGQNSYDLYTISMTPASEPFDGPQHFDRATFTGTIDTLGNISGTFSGTVQYMLPPYSVDLRSSVFTWTLVPVTSVKV